MFSVSTASFQNVRGGGDYDEKHGKGAMHNFTHDSDNFTDNDAACIHMQDTHRHRHCSIIRLQIENVHGDWRRSDTELQFDSVGYFWQFVQKM